MGAYSRAVLQWTGKLRVVARQQANKSPIAQNAHPYRQNPAGEGEHTKYLPIKREVDTIFGGPCKVGKSHQACDRYVQEARYLLGVMVHVANAYLMRGIISKP